MFNILRCSACCRPSRTWIPFNRFSAIFEAFVPYFYLRRTQLHVPKSLLYHLNSFCGGMLKLNAKFDADLLLYLLKHVECDSHTVHTHMVTQWCLSPSLTTVKLSLFMHMHSRPFPLAGRLHQCHSKCSCYIKNGWTFSRQTSYTWRT